MTDAKTLVRRLRGARWDGPPSNLDIQAADAIEELTAALAAVKHQLDGKWRLPPPVELIVNVLLTKYGASNG